MKKIVEVRNSRTYNLGNYENEKPEVAITYELSDGENLEEVVNKLKRYIDAKLDEWNPRKQDMDDSLPF